MGKCTSDIDLSGTHLPVLAKLLQNTSGAVLEIGAGFNSTPLLYWYCLAYQRPFASFENDENWCEKLGRMTTFVGDWKRIEPERSKWSIAFIDCRPALERHRWAIRLKDSADFIVVHDSEPEIDRFYAYRRIWSHFKYRYDFKLLKPNTSVVSNFVDPLKILS